MDIHRTVFAIDLQPGAGGNLLDGNVIKAGNFGDDAPTAVMVSHSALAIPQAAPLSGGRGKPTVEPLPVER
jgi:hypothetical protein